MPDWKQAIHERLSALKFDPSSEAQVIEELAQDLEDRYQDSLAHGVSPEESQRYALAELDDLAPLSKALPRARPVSALGLSSAKAGHLYCLTHDLKIAFRNMRTKPSFSLMVIGMLALGIAGNAAIFSIFSSLFLRPLPFEESGQLINLDETAPKWNLKFVGVSSIDLDEWGKNNSTFANMAFFRTPSYTLSDRGLAQHVNGAQVTRDMLDVLGLKPLLGRNFLPEEDRPGGAKVLLLSYSLWRSTFQGDRGILGRTLKLDDQPYTVIGVLPREAVFPDRVDLWTPLAPDPARNSGYYVSGIGRLKPGVSIEQAQSDLLRIHRAMIAKGRQMNEITSPILTPLRDRILGNFKIVSRALVGAVGVVLLIACANIAALMMVRGSFRAREIAIRTALGASRTRIVAQLMTENLLLAAIGGSLGAVLGIACLRFMISAMPQDMPQWISFSLDARFVLFCVAVTAAAAILFGLAPSFGASRADIRAPLQNTATRLTASRGRRATLSALVVCEIGMALLLSVSAGLLVKAFRKVLEIDPGFRPENVLTFEVGVPDATYDNPQKKIAYYNNLLARLRAVAGVKAAGATSSPPLGGQWGSSFEAENGRRAHAPGEDPTVLRVAATSGYFASIGMTLLDGRVFDEREDKPNAQPVAMVNESFAKYFWGNGSPVGKRIRPGNAKDWVQVVGLLRDEKHYGLDQDMKPAVFHPYAPTITTAGANDARALHSMTVVMRTSIAPQTLIAPAREILRQLDPGVPMYAIHTMTEKLDQSLWARRAYSWLFGSFAVIALLLAAAGVYGIISYTVSQRTQEIGIRLALGARPEQVLRQILFGGMALVSVGITAGLAGALSATRLLRTLLFGVSASDPFLYAAIVLGILGVGLLANFAPAYRAAKIDPMQALHLE